MSGSSQDLIFVSDPARFMEALRKEDPAERFAAFARFDDVVICEIMRYGIICDEAMVPPLQELYRKYVLEIPTDRRTEIFNHIKGLVKNVEWVSANALLPFIAEEKASHIVSTATIDFVSLAPMRDNDPMTAPTYIVDLIRSGAIQNVGGAFGGLLNLGDSRVCRLIVPLRDDLDQPEVREAIHRHTGFLYASTVEFYLDWLEGLDDDPKGLFGVVAAGLGRMKRYSPQNVVYSGRLRPIPSRGISAEVWQDMLRAIPVEEYVKIIAPRLYALERSEPPPKVMPHVLVTWGLNPLSDPSEIAELDDRLSSRPPG